MRVIFLPVVIWDFPQGHSPSVPALLDLETRVRRTWFVGRNRLFLSSKVPVKVQKDSKPKYTGYQKLQSNIGSILWLLLCLRLRIDRVWSTCVTFATHPRSVKCVVWVGDPTFYRWHYSKQSQANISQARAQPWAQGTGIWTVADAIEQIFKKKMSLCQWFMHTQHAKLTYYTKFSI